MSWNDWTSLPSRVWRRLNVKKDLSDDSGSKLVRCLKPLDAYCLCMGALIRSMFWELPNEAELFGYNTVFSTAIAGIASTITIHGYCELATRYPSTGFGYDYVYHFMGELPAFLVGWTVILSISIRLMCISSYFGEVLHYSIFKEIPAPANYSFMFFNYDEDWYLINLKYCPDYYTMATALILSSLYFLQFKTQKTINTLIVIFGIIALTTALAILWFGVKWWHVPFHAFQDQNEVNQFVYGCFLVYAGLIEVEVLLCLGEEIENPTRNIPLIMNSIIKQVCIGYFIALYLYSAASLLEGYHSDVRLPLASILSNFGLPPKSILIVFGCFCVLFSTMYSRIYIISRVMYAMSKDGLLFECFSFVDRRTRTPVVVCFTFLVINLVVTVFTKPTHLFLRVARCGLFIVKIVMSVCVLISRYQCLDKRRRRLRSRWILINADKRLRSPTPLTEYVSLKLILITILLLYIIVLMCNEALDNYNSFVQIVLIVSIILAVCSSLALRRQPQNHIAYSHRYLPSVPFVPFLVIMWDLAMIVITGTPPLILLLIWTGLGLVYYFSYSIHYSKRKSLAREQESYTRRSRQSSELEESGSDVNRSRSRFDL